MGAPSRTVPTRHVDLSKHWLPGYMSKPGTMTSRSTQLPRHALLEESYAPESQLHPVHPCFYIRPLWQPHPSTAVAARGPMNSTYSPVSKNYASSAALSSSSFTAAAASRPMYRRDRAVTAVPRANCHMGTPRPSPSPPSSARP
jgi:hypothetical protein